MGEPLLGLVVVYLAVDVDTEAREVWDFFEGFIRVVDMSDGLFVSDFFRLVFEVCLIVLFT